MTVCLGHISPSCPLFTPRSVEKQQDSGSGTSVGGGGSSGGGAVTVNPGESPADAIVRHLSGVRAKELWVVANDLRYSIQ